MSCMKDHNHTAPPFSSFNPFQPNIYTHTKGTERKIEQAVQQGKA